METLLVLLIIAISFWVGVGWLLFGWLFDDIGLLIALLVIGAVLTPIAMRLEDANRRHGVRRRR